MKRQFINTVLALIVICSSTTIWAQKNKLRKAEKESDNYAYVDARAIYLKVVEQGFTSPQIYESLGNTYYWNSDYSNAAQWYGLLLSEFSEKVTPEIMYRAAQAYKSSGDSERASDILEKLNRTEGVLPYMGTSEVNQLPFEVTLMDLQGINSAYSDYAPALLGNSIVFSSTRPDGQDPKLHKWTNQPFSRLYQSKFDESGHVIEVDPLRGSFEPNGYQSTATFTSDGKVMYFTQSQSLSKEQMKSDPTMRLKLVRAELMENGEWGNFKDLSLNDVAFSSAHPALSADESKLYFASDRPGGLGNSDLWYSVILGDSISAEPVNLGAKVNTAGRDTFPFITAEDILYFSSDSYAGMGGLDIYNIDLNDLNKGVTQLSQPINGPMDDFGFVYDQSLGTGYFSSNRNGTDSQGDEIFRFKSVCKILLNGNVYDKETGDDISGAFVQVFNGDNSVIHEFVLEQDALFSFEHKCDEDLRIVASAPGYEPNEVMLHTPSISAEQKISIPLEFKDLCRPNDLGCKLNLLPIYFDFDRYNIRQDAAVELAKILVAMQEYPELIINIESHTDQRGTAEYNTILSSKRAAATRAWLIENGIAPERLSSKGFGESLPLVDCSKGNCTEEEHQLNRRSDFLIQQ